MILIDALTFLFFYFIFCGLGLYIQALIKTRFILGNWNFTMTKTHIGVCKYPYWVLFWLHWLHLKIRS